MVNYLVTEMVCLHVKPTFQSLARRTLAQVLRLPTQQFLLGGGVIIEMYEELRITS